MARLRPAILTYHSLDDSGSPISTPPDDFRDQMRSLKRRGAPVAPLAEAVRGAGIALTFDDGFQNFYTSAFPILSDLGLPATVFVVAGHCGGWNYWGHGRHSVPRLPLMSWSELSEVTHRGIQVGAHTLSHPNLEKLPQAEIVSEMDGCSEEIRARLGQAPEFLAYPYGAATARVKKIAEERFRGACGTDLAFLSPDCDPYALPRLDAYYLRGPWFERFLDGSAGEYLAVRRLLRRFRAWASLSS